MKTLTSSMSAGHDDHVIADLIRNPEGQGGGSRHSGLDPESIERCNALS